jgi:hypothetical protein
MEFSSEILIESGLNLAGYLVVAALLYLLTARRTVRPPRPGKRPTDVVAHQTAAANSPVTVRTADSPVFVSLAATAPSVRTEAGYRSAAPKPDVLTESSRRENRRAIYREARRLLAQGNSRRELLDKFPLTEDEIELLSVTGKA